MINIRPNTDTALFTAMSYHLCKTGQNDKAYLAKYTVGFDKYLAYLDGTEDGVEKKHLSGLKKLQVYQRRKSKN